MVRPSDGSRFALVADETGTGSHSQVFRAVERATGNLVAVKAIHTDWLDRRRVEFLRAEIDIHNEVSRHPFVVRLLGVFDDSEAQFIVQELAEGGSLLDHLHSRESMETEAEVRPCGCDRCGRPDPKQWSFS